MSQCPLCGEEDLREFHIDKRRSYLQCSECHLVSVPHEHHLSSALEKAEYDKHQNNSEDEGYRRFLARTFTPLVAQIPEKAVGLDYGCGPGPTISEMAKELGILMYNYDLYYFNQPDLLDKQYDFVTMTEVIEHIADPQSLLNRLDSMLKKSGILAIMTKRVQSRDAFAGWHYKNDPTHICFYSIATFEWIARMIGWRLEIIDKDVVFFHKE